MDKCGHLDSCNNFEVDIHLAPKSLPPSERHQPTRPPPLHILLLKWSNPLLPIIPLRHYRTAIQRTHGAHIQYISIFINPSNIYIKTAVVAICRDHLNQLFFYCDNGVWFKAILAVFLTLVLEIIQIVIANERGATETDRIIFSCLYKAHETLSLVVECTCTHTLFLLTNIR